MATESPLAKLHGVPPELHGYTGASWLPEALAVLLAPAACSVLARLAASSAAMPPALRWPDRAGPTVAAIGSPSSISSPFLDQEYPRAFPSLSPHCRLHLPGAPWRNCGPQKALLAASAAVSTTQASLSASDLDGSGFDCGYTCCSVCGHSCGSRCCAQDWC